jgi:DNA polymerase III epsilon subunit-like protein
MTDVYVSVDIETDGDAPGLSSMLSIGAVALYPESFSSTMATHSSFYATLKRLPEARPSTATMEWWDQFPKQWAETRLGAADPAVVMKNLEWWVQKVLQDMEQKGVKDPVAIFVAAPIGFDFSFVYYYLHRFLGRCVFGHNGVDLRSVAMGILGNDYRYKTENYPQEWKTTLQHTHNALEDAEEQADRFRLMMTWRRKMELRLKAQEKT